MSFLIFNFKTTRSITANNYKPTLAKRSNIRYIPFVLDLQYLVSPKQFCQWKFNQANGIGIETQPPIEQLQTGNIGLSLN